MSKTKIEWLRNTDGSSGYTINPVKGLCPMDCKDNQGKSYCYARKMYKRFNWNPEIRFDAYWFEKLPSKPSKIFVGSTMELFGDWNKWMGGILLVCKNFPQHTFIFLTKQPQNLAKWSPFPENIHIGVSITNQTQYDEALFYLKDIDAKVKFLSFEPLLEHIDIDG